MIAAANAYRLNNTKAGRENVESYASCWSTNTNFSITTMKITTIRDEHKAATRLTIDRLAARVLDFDLRYVLKRMEKEHEHEHKEGDHEKRAISSAS